MVVGKHEIRTIRGRCLGVLFISECKEMTTDFYFIRRVRDCIQNAPFWPRLVHTSILIQYQQWSMFDETMISVCLRNITDLISCLLIQGSVSRNKASM